MVYKSDYSEHTLLHEKLKTEYVGKTLDDIPTPAFIIDRRVYKENCAAMIKKANEWGAGFRAHLKTHKVRADTPYDVELSYDDGIRQQRGRGCSL
jgi:hypothetical protein